MAARRRGLRRAGRAICFVAATGLAVAGIVTAPSAAATGQPTFTYSSKVGAIGAQLALFSQPEPSSVPDLTDVQTPSSDGQLDSFGTSEANGHVGNLNGLGSLPSLICLASAAFCNAIPVSQLSGGTITSFPPPDPFDAHAVYPAHQQDAAPSLGGKPASVKVRNGPLTLGAGNAEATAGATSTTTSGVDSKVSFLGGISIGSLRTQTTQKASGSTLTTTASATAGNIDIGTAHLLHIGSVRSTLSVVSQPHKPAVDHASSIISGVTVLGQPASIDHKGVHMKAVPGVPTAVTAAYQKAISTLFSKSGFHLRQADVHRADSHSGHTVSVAGLELFFTRVVKGTPPITIGLPQGVPCPISPITSKLPVDPCAGLGLSLNAKYRGQVALATVDATSLAAPAGNPSTSIGPGLGSGGGPPPAGPGTAIGAGSVPTGGGGGNLAAGPSAASAGGAAGGAPTVAGAPSRPVADPLSGLSGRLWWFFPLIALSVLALVGRLRTPARLPAP